MAARFYTEKPKTLLRKFNEAIDAGEIRTWERDADGDYTHKASQWAKKAWFRPRTFEDRLVFNILRPEGKSVDRTVYGYYHGHLIETFLVHFEENFTTGAATAKPTSDDLV